MKLIISFITYNQASAKYLPAFLASLKESLALAKNHFVDLDPLFFVFDNSDQDKNINKDILKDFFINNNFSYKIWDEGQNLGFAKSYNIMLSEALKKEINLFLVINPDVLVDNNFISELLKKEKQCPEISVFCPKILYWDFANNTLTDIIDSYGVSLNTAHRFFDRGQGLPSTKYSDQEQEIFAFSGAGALFRLNDFIDIAPLKEGQIKEGQREFFDEMMFMYKEDIDLSYRLQLAGKKILFTPQALMYHDRTLSSQNNKIWRRIFSRKKNNSADHSLINHLIILEKIKNIPFSTKVKLRSKFRKFLLILFSFFFQRRALFSFWRLRPQIKQKGLKIKPKNREWEKIEEFMHRS